MINVAIFLHQTIKRVIIAVSSAENTFEIYIYYVGVQNYNLLTIISQWGMGAPIVWRALNSGILWWWCKAFYFFNVYWNYIFNFLEIWNHKDIKKAPYFLQEVRCEIIRTARGKSNILWWIISWSSGKNRLNHVKKRIFQAVPDYLHGFFRAF